MAPRESILVQALKAAEKKEEDLRAHLRFSRDKHAELRREIERRTQTEAELLQQCSQIQSESDEWKRRFSKAMESYHAVNEEIAIKSKAREEAAAARNAELTLLRTQLAATAKQVEPADERGMHAELTRLRARLIAAEAKQAEDEQIAISENIQKDAHIMVLESEIMDLKSPLAALEEDKRKADEEARNSAKFILDTLLRIRKVVHDFMVDVREFQIDLPHSDKMSGESPSCKHGDEIPDVRSLTSCEEELVKVIGCAKSDLNKATKAWRNTEYRVRLFKVAARKCVLNTVLGKRPTVNAGRPSCSYRLPNS